MQQAISNHSNNPINKPIRVLVVDDQSFICLLVQKILEAADNIECVGTVQKGKSVIGKLKSISELDVVLLDMEMPGTDVTKLIKEICISFPNIGVLIYSSHSNKEYLQKALSAGAKGYLLKGCADNELINGITAINHGYAQFSPQLLPLISGESSSFNSVSNGKSELKDDETQWATATLDRIESMPRVSLRILLYLFMGAIALVIPWSLLFKFTVTAEALGKLEPSTKIYQLDAPTSGKVTKVNVKPGQKVASNQVLLNLDSFAANSELKNNQHNLKLKQKRLKQLKIILSQEEKNLSESSFQISSRAAEQEAEIAAGEAEIKSKQLELTKTQLRYQAAKKKAERYLEAHEQGALSKDLLANTQELAQQEEQNVIQVRAEIVRAEANYKRSLSTLSSLDSQGRIEVGNRQQKIEELKGNLAEATGEIERIRNNISVLKHQLHEQTILAPTDGQIFELSVNKPGNVVRQGDFLVSIAPQNSQPVFRGQIKTKDSGFLQVGMVAAIELDSYSRREYGLVSGKVKRISPTSFTNQNNEEVFEVEIELDREDLSETDLIYGQTASAEITIKKLRLINFWLD